MIGGVKRLMQRLGPYGSGQWEPLEAADRSRLAFVDALRGLAFVFMVLNHVASSLLDASFGVYREALIYVTVTLAAPLFLFLVGFSMALPHAGREAPKPLSDSLKKGLVLIAAGFALTAITAPENPIFTGGILQTIGLGIICLAPFVRFMARRSFRHALLLLAASLYGGFIFAYPAVMARLAESPLMLPLFFDGFPPWPWISVVMLGLVLGSCWAREPNDNGEITRMLGRVASLCLVLYVSAGYLTGNLTRVDFGRDLVINDHWMPSPVTVLWILAALGGNFLLVHFLSKTMAWHMTWLRVMGRAALLLYVVHLLLIRVLGKRVLGLNLDSWWQYIAANLVLLAILLCVGGVTLNLIRLRHMRRSACQAAS